MDSQKGKERSRSRYINFQQLKDIVGNEDKTKEEKRKAFVDFFGERKKEKNG